ncbi:MAG: hypothetical protein ACOYN0_12130, partial [Phycisphaerales bacterium]
PLGHAFKAGQTDLYSGVEASAAIGKSWKPRSATLLLVSDGDTIPEKSPTAIPACFGDVLVVGVGDPFRASPVADRVSRQDAASLKRLAARLGGDYFDANARHLPTRTLRELKMMGLREDKPTPLRTIALATAGTSAAVLAGVTPLLVAFGVRSRRATPASAPRPARGAPLLELEGVTP